LFSPLKLEQGDWPQGPEQVVIDAGTAGNEGYGPGDSVQVTAQGATKRYEVTGVATYGEVDSLGGATIAVFDTPTARAVLGKEGVYDGISIAAAEDTSPAELVSAVEPLVPASLQVRNSEEEAAEQAKETNDALSIVRYFLLGFGGIALFVGAFVILNTLSITVAQRTREFATLRTLGASRRQVLRSVVVEGLAIGLLASVAGLVLGIGIAKGMNELFKVLGTDLPASGTVLETRTIIVSLLVGTLITLIASLAPARRATRVPPIAAVREGSTLPPSRLAGHSLKLAVGVIAASVAAISAGVFAVGLRRRDGHPGADPDGVRAGGGAGRHRGRDPARAAGVAAQRPRRPALRVAMTATLTPPRPAAAPSSGRSRARLARVERPLFLAGLALVTLHLLDLAFSGPDTSLLGVVSIVAVSAGWALARPYLVRATRLVLGVVVGLLTFGFAVISHGLHVVNSGPDLTDVTGVGMVVGGLLLVVSGLAALFAPRRAPRRAALGWRLAHGAGWVVSVPVVAVLFVMPFAMTLKTTHAPRREIQEASLGIPHEEVAIETADGRELSAWYVPSRNGAGVLLSHGSGGSRERVAAHIRMLARNGYGVLAFDNPGNGESEGHSNGLGDNAQPGVTAALGWLDRRPDVDPGRLAGFGSSLGGEVLLEAAAREPRLRAVVADGPTRPRDAMEVSDPSAVERVFGELLLRGVRGISGMRESPSLLGFMPRIAPRPVLLIAGGVGTETEIPANRRYQDAGGPAVELWEIPDAGHTAGLRTHPVEYERRVVAFLDDALTP
jgi:alpha-beta hydrolase superfamily lysophospholipase